MIKRTSFSSRIWVAVKSDLFWCQDHNLFQSLLSEIIRKLMHFFYFTAHSCLNRFCVQYFHYQFISQFCIQYLFCCSDGLVCKNGFTICHCFLLQVCSPLP